LAFVRWGVTPLQIAPLIVGLLAWFYVALIKCQYWLVAAIAGTVLACKMTLVLPFFGLLLLHRKFLACVALGLIWLGLNALGFWRMGGMEAWTAYANNMAIVEAMDGINTPDPWRMISIPRLDWVYLAYGITGHLPISRLLALTACLVCLSYLFWKGLRSGSLPTKQLMDAYLTPLTCLTLLAVYHHHYDISLMLVPLLVTALTEGKSAFFKRRNIWLLPMIGLMAAAPVGFAQTALATGFSPVAAGVFRMCFPIVLTLALAVSLLSVSEMTKRASAAPVA
jgi:hypothetical protein